LEYPCALDSPCSREGWSPGPDCTEHAGTPQTPNIETLTDEEQEEMELELAKFELELLEIEGDLEPLGREWSPSSGEEEGSEDWDQEYSWFIEEDQRREAALQRLPSHAEPGAPAAPVGAPVRPLRSPRARKQLRLQLPAQKAEATRTDLGQPERFGPTGLTVTATGTRDDRGRPVGLQMGLQGLGHPKFWMALASDHGVYRAHDVQVVGAVRTFLALGLRGAFPALGPELLQCICGPSGFLPHHKVLKLVAADNGDHPHLRDNAQRELRHLHWCEAKAPRPPPYVLTTEGAFLIDHELVVRRLLPRHQKSAPIHKTVAFLYPYHPGVRNLSRWFAPAELAALRTLGCRTRRAVEALIQLVVYKVVKALAALHADHIVHHDLKLDQILMSWHEVWLCDYGSSVERLVPSSGCHFVCHPKVLTPTHSHVKDDWSGSQEVQCCTRYDIWSAGVAFMELVTGKTALKGPFQSQRRSVDELHTICAGCDMPPDFHEFLALCLEPTTEYRPTAEELLDSPYLRPFQGDAVTTLQRRQEALLIQLAPFLLAAPPAPLAAHREAWEPQGRGA